MFSLLLSLSLCSPHCCLPVSLFSSSSPRTGFCHGLLLGFLCSSGSWPRFVSAPSLPPLQGDHCLCSAPERLVLVLPALLQGRSSHQGSATCCYQNLKLLLSFLPPPPTPRQAAGQRTPWLLGCAEGRQGRATRSQPVGSHLLLCLPNTHLAHFLLFLFTRSLLVTYNIWHYLTTMFVFAEPDLAADSHGGWLKCTVCLNNLVKDYIGNILKRSTIGFLHTLPALHI